MKSVFSQLSCASCTAISPSDYKNRAIKTAPMLLLDMLDKTKQ